MPGYLQYSFVVPEGTGEIAIEVEVQAGGGLFGGGGGAAPELTAVFKLGSEPVQYTLGFGAGSGRHDGELEVAFVDGKLVIAGQEEQPLTPGTWTFAIHNSGGAGALNGISVTFEQ